ncbi:MAG: hypothetical protein AUK55_12280 [Syntrophobacteraceae bacterium CG2_30_61_12]|nr:MAG: hypothetical protein AUK55_12280 [Syntrophobacteraceae bacterium CG2_30_61_12]
MTRARAAVSLVFPDWAEYCDGLLSRDQVERVKPDPDHLLAALSGLGSSPRHCLMVGDHLLDIETGRRAGTWTAAVASGKLGAGNLAQGAPDWLATDCAELIGILNGQARLRGKPLSQPAAF